MRRLFAALMLAGLLCSCDDAAPTYAWKSVAVPDGLSPVMAVSTSHGLLVGAESDADAPMPRLLTFEGDEWTAVPVAARSYYAKRGRWRSILTIGDRVLALSAIPGGAHFNPRWTTWEGTFDGVTDYVQTMSTFGGPRAGSLRGLVAVDGQPAIVGSWISDEGVLDIATWSVVDHTWTRHPSAGTPLAGSRTSLVSVRASGPGPILVGSVTSLGDGIRVEPVWWRGPEWDRAVLPGGTGEALAEACGADECLVAGYVGKRLALWENGERLDTPEVAAGNRSTIVVSPDARALLVWNGSRSVLVSRSGDEWSTSEGPPGQPTSWAEADGTSYVTTLDTSGARALWYLDGTL